jgi:hypothetical protein
MKPIAADRQVALIAAGATAAASESASCATPALCIEHSVTVDMADGQPLPPLIENGVVWRVVRRANGRTIWRRLFLTSFCRHHEIRPRDE